MRLRRFMIPGVIVVVAVGAVALLIYGVSNHTDTASIDYKVASGHYPKAPHYTEKLPVLGSSATRSLASFKGKVVVMNVWASWCEPCQAEAPMFGRYESTLRKEGATFVGVTFQTSPGQAESFNRRYGITYPSLRDVSGDFSHSFGTFQVPETFIISRQGKIEALMRNAVTEQWLSQNLKKVLKDGSS
jgi:cytochrome c biogenesis protein CcmG/thiol:disulfide interchange protein DsbE